MCVAWALSEDQHIDGDVFVTVGSHWVILGNFALCCWFVVVTLGLSGYCHCWLKNLYCGGEKFV